LLINFFYIFSYFKIILLSIVRGDILNGLIYLIVFSVGLALSLTTLSTLFIKSKEFIQKYAGSRKINKLPLISGTIIILIGVYTLGHPILEFISKGWFKLIN